jgi:Heterokaryon incompatibility protein (HET)
MPPRKFRRILDIGTTRGAETIRLVEAREVAVDAGYMTLSHCWGNVEILKLVTDTYESMRQEMVLKDLPKTFRDAIDVARELGNRFLWIDSLCIVQDSVEDWRSQAAVMGEIYQGSVCNIAATAARDGHGGLLMHLRRNPAYVERLQVHVPDMGQQKFEDIEEKDEGTYDSIYPMKKSKWTGMAAGYYDCCDLTIWWREVSDSPLLRRAWVVQERLLAPRVVHFGAHQIFWECNTLKACELYPSGLLQEGDLEPAPKSKDITSGHSYPESWASPKDWNDIGPCPQILRSWGDIVEAYTLGKLTFESDKLVAISGLQSIYASRIKAPYLTGLWGVHLPRQLLWAMSRPAERPKKYRAPSWSWASVNGQVDRSTFLDTDDLMVKRLITILGIPEQNKPEPTQGLRVQGRLINCSLDFDPDAFYEAGRYNPLVRGLECAAVVMPDTTELGGSDKGVLVGPFFCVPVAIICEANTPTTSEVAGFVLQPTGSKGIFRRFGAFRTDQEVGRDGDSIGDSHMHLAKSESSQPGRVFLMDVEDELAEVEERFYESYEITPEKKGYGNFVFTII